MVGMMEKGNGGLMGALGYWVGGGRGVPIQRKLYGFVKMCGFAKGMQRWLYFSCGSFWAMGILVEGIYGEVERELFSGGTRGG